MKRRGKVLPYLDQLFTKHWYRPCVSFWLYLLYPLACVFRLIVWWRFKKYGMQYQTDQTTTPIIIVGNITIGGSGKTPFVVALVEYLCQQGWHPGVIMRGYGGHMPHYPSTVQPGGDCHLYGDESVLLANRLTVPVVVDPNRARGAKWLSEKHQCSIIISDDGLQHYRLKRNIEIIMFDGKYGLGNRHTFPVGPLRDTVAHLATADFLISKGSIYTPLPVQQDAHIMEIEALYVEHLISGQRLSWKAFKTQHPRTVHAVAGIGQPESFFNLLERMGFNIIRHDFADHYAYTQKDFLFEHHPIFMTEKDAVKCRSFATSSMWFIPINAHLSHTFWQQLDNTIKEKCPCPTATASRLDSAKVD